MCWEAEADSSSYSIKEETDPNNFCLEENDKYEYSEPAKIQSLVKNYSQFVSFPIYTWQEKSRTIEFLSMKLTAASTFYDFNSKTDALETLQVNYDFTLYMELGKGVFIFASRYGCWVWDVKFFIFFPVLIVSILDKLFVDVNDFGVFMGELINICTICNIDDLVYLLVK